MALPTSPSSLSLNQIHIEAGGSSGSTCSLNDTDIRGLISKTSGATSSISDWYGASNVTMYNVGAATTVYQGNRNTGGNFHSLFFHNASAMTAIGLAYTNTGSYTNSFTGGNGFFISTQNTTTFDNGKYGDVYNGDLTLQAIAIEAYPRKDTSVANGYARNFSNDYFKLYRNGTLFATLSTTSGVPITGNSYFTASQWQYYDYNVNYTSLNQSNYNATWTLEYYY
jgi:hypothetical protein